MLPDTLSGWMALTVVAVYLACWAILFFLTEAKLRDLRDRYDYLEAKLLAPRQRYGEDPARWWRPDLDDSDETLHKPYAFSWENENFTDVEVVADAGDTVAVFTAEGVRWVADEEDRTLRVFVEASREDLEEACSD